MDRGELHAAVARAIAKTMRQPGGWTDADLAAVAIRVVLAEVRLQVEQARDASDWRTRDAFQAMLVAFDRLVPPPPV